MAKNASKFDPSVFLATIGEGRTILAFSKKQAIFTQGDEADSVFYVQKGKVRLTVVSKTGKEATIGIVIEGNFFGEGSLAAQLRRMGSAVAMTDCEILRVEKKAMVAALHREATLSDLFVSYFTGAQCPLRSGPGRPTLQLQRKAAGPYPSLARSLWQSG